MEEERQYQPGQIYHPGPNRFGFFAGVIMPALSITVEATSHICAEVFFDPIPTVWHLLLVLFVPLAQLQVWFAIRRRATDRLALAGFLNAVVIGISIFYSIVYLPLASSTEANRGHSSAPYFFHQGKWPARRPCSDRRGHRNHRTSSDCHNYRLAHGERCFTANAVRRNSLPPQLR
jgi:hypothetical protein